jgi:hypothetical protein
VNVHSFWVWTATYEATGHSYLSLVYFIIVTVMGMYIIMSLFIAILLEKFACQDTAKFELEDQYAVVRFHCSVDVVDGRCRDDVVWVVSRS